MANLSSIIPPVNVANASGVLPVGSGGTGSTTSTGSGSVVLANSPSLVTPALGAATATSLTASGLVQSTSGGFKFPDGTTQTTAATGIPTGYVVSTPLSLSAPDWLPANGTVYLKSSYTALSNALGSLADGTSFTTWTARTSNFGGNQINAVTFGNGLFVIVGNSGRISTSPNGVTWTSRNPTYPNAQFDNFLSVAFGAGVYVAGADGSGRLATSTDGVNWTLATIAGWPGIRNLTFGGGLFMAVSNFGQFATSPDGVNWTSRTLGFSARSAAFGGGVFVAVGDVSGANNIATSTDGINWTARPAGGWAGNIQRITYGNGIFVALGGSAGSGNTSPLWSPDGITWPGTQVTVTSYAFAPSSLVFAGGVFLFGNISEGTLFASRIGVSNDWTQRASSTATGFTGSPGIAGMTYANGLLVAVGGTRVATGPVGYDTSTSFCTPTANTSGLNSFIKA